MKRERIKSTIAVVAISIILLIAGYIEVEAATIVFDTPDAGESSTIMTNRSDGGSTIIHCFTGESGLTICQEL